MLNYIVSFLLALSLYRYICVIMCVCPHQNHKGLKVATLPGTHSAGFAQE